MIKVHITITDKHGNIFEGEVDLVPAASKPSASKRYKPASRQQPLPAKLIFTVNERAFIKKHVRGLVGAKKFVLLLAYMAKGEAGKEVQLKELEKRWNKMTSSSLLGLEFNRKYSASARENGWADTKKPGPYVLCQSWKEVLEHPRVVMDILGHSQIGITMNLYAHVLPPYEKRSHRGWTRTSPQWLPRAALLPLPNRRRSTKS